MHRVMNREGSGYLQQACGYLPINAPDWRASVGRIFAVNQGLIGAAFSDKKIWRTKEYSNESSFLPELEKAVRESGDEKQIEDVAKSYLAIPFLGPQNDVVLILYADCGEFNFFAKNDRVTRVVAMCHGFCRLFDRLQEEPFPTIRNFPLRQGVPVAAKKTLYQSIQESLDIPPPTFVSVTSFNYEASVA
jgi:hypothetical protein